MMVEAGFPAETMRAQQVMCMAEEAGKAVKAARRYMGLARTPGTLEELTEELADVAIASAAMAEAFGIDLNGAVVARLQHVMERPVRKEVPGGFPTGHRNWDGQKWVPADDRPVRSPGDQH
jgi:NTP pyrophosphatase (non-canonical NTP hydrolase)